MKSFDLVGHRVLLQNMKLYNFSDGSIKFFKEYLENRKQVIQIESKWSSPKDVGDVGVSQGSVLGVLGFLINQNDFPNNKEDVVDDNDNCDDDNDLGVNDDNSDDDINESVLYVDDDTDNVCDKDPDSLQEKLQRQADKSTEWIRDNGMVCSGGKTKLLIMATREQRARKLIPTNKQFCVNVCGKVVKESTDEKLLGLVISNNLTFKTHLNGNNLTGDDKIVGLITQLSKRVGILKRLSAIMTRPQFSNACEAIFTSKLTYCCQVIFNIWDIQSMDEIDRRFSAFQKQDSRRLQVLQNKLLRLKTGLAWDTPTAKLLEASGDLSVQQLAAYHTVMTVFRVLNSDKPKYLCKKLQLRQPQNDGIFPHKQKDKIVINNCHLSLHCLAGGLFTRVLNCSIIYL